MGILGVLSVTGAARSSGTIFLLVAVYGAATAFFGPAFDALVPRLVDNGPGSPGQRHRPVRPARAHGMAGPALGGLLIAVGGSGGAFLVDALTFAVSMVCLARVGLGCPTPADDRRAGVPARRPRRLRRHQEGFRYVRANAWLWATLLAATFAYLLFTGPVDVLLPYLVKNELKAGARHPRPDPGRRRGRRHRRRPGRRVARHAPAEHDVHLRGVDAVDPRPGRLRPGPRRLAGVLVSFVFNALETAGTVVWLTTKQRLVPRALLGRVSSFDWFISTGLVPLSFAIVAPVAAVIGARNTFMLAGGLGAAVTLAFLCVPGVRSVDIAVAEEPEPDVAVSS